MPWYGFEGQANWRQRDPDGYLPAPPHDKTGLPGIILTHVFLMTKYGIEKMIRRKYPTICHIKISWRTEIITALI